MSALPKILRKILLNHIILQKEFTKKGILSRLETEMEVHL